MKNLPVVSLCVLFCVLALASVNEAILYTPDSARYLIWADALADGDGFADRSSPEPSRYVVHAPLYPILLAPVALIAPLSVTAAKCFNILLGAGLLFMFYRFIRRSTSDRAAFGATLLLSVHALFLIYTTQVLSEIPFAIALLVSVVELVRLDASSKRFADFAALALALGAGLFLREVGAALVAAVLVWFVIRKDWRSAAILFALCGVLYGLWFVRNEMIVAPIEQPPLRNSKLFFAHLFTPANASIVEEFLARITTNASVYGAHAATLVFAPDFARTTHGMVTLNHPLVSLTTASMPFLKPLYLLLTVGLVASAVRYRWKSDNVVRALSVMGLLYAGPILLYPINDVRFLFPVYLLLLSLMTIGAFEVYTRFSALVAPALRRVVLAFLWVVALFPSASWASSFFENNARFAHDHETFLAELEADDRLPDYYLKDVPAAGAWIDANAPADAVVLSRWKELALYVSGRKIIDVDPQLTPDSFDRMLRDYNVRYIATVVWRTGLRENETQIAYSSRFAFKTVAKEGSIEILEVSRKVPGPSVYRTIRSDDDSVAVFRTALMLLRRGQPEFAESLLVHVEQRMGRYGAIIFQQAVAKSLKGRREEALGLLERFRSMPQAGSLVQQAWYHQEILERRRLAEEAQFPEDKASRYHVVSVNYWELGYRSSAFAMIDSALAAQPAFFPALVFGSIFSYQDRDVTRARAFLAKAEAVNSSNILVVSMKSVFEADDRLKRAKSDAARVGILREKAAAFLRMDLREDAIDVWMEVLAIDPMQEETLKDLARTFEEKRRFGPALDYARRYMSGHADDEEMSSMVANMLRRW